MKPPRVALRTFAVALLGCSSTFGAGSPLAAAGADPAIGYDPFLSASTSAEKIAYLNGLVSDDRQVVDKATWKHYISVAASDPDADVRNWVANLGLLDDASVPLFIEVLMRDPEYKVRSAAAMTLSDWITDGGAETCSAVHEVEQHLPALLQGLDDGATAQNVIEIVGGNYSGEKPLACCMRSGSRALIRDSLQSRIGKRPVHVHNWGDQFLIDALTNISSCK